MKKILILLLFLSTPLIMMAQKENPKWVEKAKQAVFSVITYDKEDKLLNTGNGFFISEDGVALSDYSIFKGAERAVVINFEGKQLPVQVILGVNEMYDVIKFRVAVEKKIPALSVASAVAAKGAEVYLLPYSTKKDRNCMLGTVEDVSSLSGGYSYYTLKMPLKEKMISCPIANADGQVIGLAQKDAVGDSTFCYAVGASFAAALTLNALSVNDDALKSIQIKKALPAAEDQALVYLYMASTGLTADEYLLLLNDFIAQFPQSTEGYIRRAGYYIYNAEDAKQMVPAEEDLNKAMKIATKKDDIFYNTSKLIHSFLLSKKEFTYKDWKYEKALEEIQKAIAIDPLPLYFQHQGDVYFALQNYPKALEAYEKVNQSNLASPATFYSAAKTKQLLGTDLNEVISLLDSAVAKYTAPYPAEAAPYFFERGRIKEEREMYREAVEDYDTYFHIVNGEVNDLFYYYREQSNYKAKNFKRALEDITKALELAPQDAVYLAELGAVHLRIARYEEAIQNLKDALQVDPKFAACYRLMGFCQLQLKQNTEACENFAKAKELGDEAVIGLIEKNCK